MQVSEDTVCKGANIIFNCSAADADPMELTYHLYENNVMVINSSSTGIWNRTMTTGGVFVYSCKVTNVIGTEMSTDVSVTVIGKHGTFLTNKKALESKCHSMRKHTLSSVQCFWTTEPNVIDSHNEIPHLGGVIPNLMKQSQKACNFL